MESRPIVTAGTVVAALLVAGAVALALRPGGEVVVIDESPPVDPPGDGTAVVAALRAPGGLALFGLQIVDPTHTVEVRFLTGPGCSALLSPGDPWPAPQPECTGPAGVAGEVGSLGVTAEGRSLVGVTFAVPGACYDRLERGMVWPPDLRDCDR